ncbi:MAG: hypothetical protein IE909_17415 [Campylobacterales bacterium]|nr:hypothetical protein [Campylobacterales bacterium]
MLGNIFKQKFHKDPANMTLEDIEKTAIKRVNFSVYAKNIVSKRGNIFKNKSYNKIEENFSKKLQSYAY